MKRGRRANPSLAGGLLLLWRSCVSRRLSAAFSASSSPTYARGVAHSASNCTIRSVSVIARCYQPPQPLLSSYSTRLATLSADSRRRSRVRLRSLKRRRKAQKEGAAERGPCAPVPALLAQNVGQSLLGPRILGVERDRVLETGKRLAMPPQAREHNALADPRIHIRRVGSAHAQVGGERLGVPP